MSVPVQPTGGGQIDPVVLRAYSGDLAAVDEFAERERSQADGEKAWAEVEEQTLIEYRRVCGEFGEAFTAAREAIVALAVAGGAVDRVVDEFTLRSRTEKPGWSYSSYSTPSACGRGTPRAQAGVAVLAAAAPFMGGGVVPVDMANMFREASRNYRFPRPGGE